MEQLENALKVEAAYAGKPVDSVTTCFRQAAIDWSKHSLESYDGKLLLKALAISAAMSDFENEKERL